MPIEVKNISHIYMENTPYEKKALNNVSLTINEGEFVAIAGLQVQENPHLCNILMVY